MPRDFEAEFREFVGCEYVIATSHGHTAIAGAFFAAGVGRGDEFIHPDIGYTGSYVGALHMGATPVFCEVDPNTLLADPKDIEKRITNKTRAINPIHHAGRVCDMDALLELCRRHNIMLVEDAAHAHGSEWGGRRIGNVGHVACFSLQGVLPSGKPVAAGEGGILATNDREIYERALVYTQLHRTGVTDELTNPVYAKLEPQLLGWKWRPHPLALAIARVSLRTLPWRIQRFAENRDALVDRLRGVPGIRPVATYPKAKGSELYGGLTFLYDPDALGGLPVTTFSEALAAEGVPNRAWGFHKPEHLRSIYTEDLPGLWGRNHVGPADVPLPRYREGDYPVTEGLQSRVLRLKGWIETTDQAISQTADAFKKVVEHHKELLETAR